MGYNIYYMYDDATGEGYIGQNKDAQDDKRIVDHYNAYLAGGSELEKDGGARLIRDMGGPSSRLRYKYFREEEDYGIPKEIWTGFFNSWSIDGVSSYDKLNKDQKLDLAEMLHITAAGLQGKSWNKYNIRPGGFDSSKRLTYKFTIKEQNILQQYQSKHSGTSLRTAYDVTNFSVDLRRNPNEWKKIVFPIGQVVTTAVLEDYLNNYLINDIWIYIMIQKTMRQNMRKVIVNFVGQSFANEHLWASGIQDFLQKKQKVKAKNDQSTTMTQAENTFQNNMKELINLALQKFKGPRGEIQRLINSAIRGCNVNFKWELDERSYQVFVKQINNRVKEMTLSMWAKVLSGFNSNKDRFTTSIFKDLSISKKNTNKMVQWEIPHYMVDYTWKLDTELPEWAKALKHTLLFSQFKTVLNGKLKDDICIAICKEMFPKINDIPKHEPSRDYLLFRVIEKLNQGASDYKKEFFIILLTIWHQWKYGSGGWITKSNYFKSDQGVRSDYISNPLATNKVENKDHIWWYSGKAWSQYRDAAGRCSEGDYESAGKLLSKLWKW